MHTPRNGGPERWRDPVHVLITEEKGDGEIGATIRLSLIHYLLWADTSILADRLFTAGVLASMEAEGTLSGSSHVLTNIEFCDG